MSVRIDNGAYCVASDSLISASWIHPNVLYCTVTVDEFSTGPSAASSMHARRLTIVQVPYACCRADTSKPYGRDRSERVQ